jgi:hypothetical protein
MATVEELLGVPVDYYALVDFGAFVRFIDEIGGVKIDIAEPIRVDPLGDDNIKNLKPGRQNLPGELALAYARARKTEGGDFDRAQRQQQVIMGIRNQLLRPGMLPLLISKAPVLYNEIAAGVKTNLNLEQVIKLAWLAQQVPDENIKRGVIAPPTSAADKSPDRTMCSSRSRIRSAPCATKLFSARIRSARRLPACRQWSWSTLKRPASGCSMAPPPLAWRRALPNT